MAKLRRAPKVVREFMVYRVMPWAQVAGLLRQRRRAQEHAAQELAAQELAAQELAAKELAAKELAVRELSAQGVALT
jgi:hypothetical protein